MEVKYSYLDQQFDDVEPYLDDIRDLVSTGDFTLGAAVGEFEERFARLCGLPHAIGVGSGTDATICSRGDVVSCQVMLQVVLDHGIR